MTYPPHPAILQHVITHFQRLNIVALRNIGLAPYADKLCTFGASPNKSPTHGFSRRDDPFDLFPACHPEGFNHLIGQGKLFMIIHG